MKKSDFYREWARVLDMCEGTKVSPNDCLKLKGAHHTDEFAVAILEDKPVFVGNMLYGKRSKIFHTVSKEMIDSGEHNYSDSYYWSWNPAKERRNVHDPMRFAEGLIEQLPEAHEGKIAWLKYYGDGKMADDMREKYPLKGIL